MNKLLPSPAVGWRSVKKKRLNFQKQNVNAAV